MIRIVLALVAIVIVPTFAYAQTPAEQAVAFCEAKYSGDSPTVRLQQVLCIQDQNIKILEARIRQGEQGLAAKVERLRRELEAAKVQMPVASPQTVQTPPIAPPRPAVPSSPAPPPVPVAPPAPPPHPTFAGGVPYRIVPTPGQLAAATYDIDGHRLWIRRLHRGVDKHVWGATEVRVIVKRNGVPLTIVHEGGAINAIRADLNHDGKVDRMPYSAVDPSVIDDIYIPMVGPRTKIEIIYLVPTGKMIAVPGLPFTPIWGDPVRVKVRELPRFGRFPTNARSGKVIR